MGLMNETIIMAGRPATIIRGAGNVSTYMVADENIFEKKKVNPYNDFETGMAFPTDSTIVEGDLILSDSKYYLVMSLVKVSHFNDLLAYRGTLYRCNSTVSIYYFNSVSKEHDTLHASDIKCLITQGNEKHDEDKAFMINNYRGKRQPFQLFMRDSEGLTNTSAIVDQNSKRFRVNKQFDIFIADGIVQTQVDME